MNLFSIRAVALVAANGEVIDADGPHAPRGDVFGAIDGEMHEIIDEPVRPPTTARITGLEEQSFPPSDSMFLELRPGYEIRILDLDDACGADRSVERHTID